MLCGQWCVRRSLCCFLLDLLSQVYSGEWESPFVVLGWILSDIFWVLILSVFSFHLTRISGQVGVLCVEGGLK